MYKKVINFSINLKQNHILRSGDVIKLGRIMLKVKNFRIEDADNPEDRKENPCEDTPVDIQNSKCLPKYIHKLN